MGEDLCSRVSALSVNILSAMLVSDGSIVQWNARPGVKMQGQKEMEGTMLQRLIMMSIAKVRRGSDNIHFIMTRYGDFDMLLFDLPPAEGDKDSMLLIVSVKRPYALDSLAGEITGIARDAT